AQLENDVTDHPEAGNPLDLPPTNTDPVRVSFCECMDDPESQNGEVVYGNISYRLLLSTDLSYNFFLFFMDKLQYDSVECVDDPEGQNGEVVYGNISYRLQLNTGLPQEEEFSVQNCHQSHVNHRSHTQQDSVECVDDPEGQNGEVVYGNVSYRLQLNTGLPQEEEFSVQNCHQSHVNHRSHTQQPHVQNQRIGLHQEEARSAVSRPSGGTETPPVSVQCEENPEGQHGEVVFERMSYRQFPSTPAPIIWRVITVLCTVMHTTVFSEHEDDVMHLFFGGFGLNAVFIYDML
ncbi:hypothetical protein AMEX_G2896, partial [Astyanax mexicanus]